MRRFITLVLAFLFAVSTAAPIAAENGGLKLPPYKKLKLKNGMTLLLMEQHEVPIVNFNLVVRSGWTADPSGKEGLAAVTAALLRKGTKTRSADTISQQLDFIGGLLDASAAADYTVGRAEFMAKDIAKGTDLLSDVLLNPTFPEDELAKMLKQRIDGVKAAKDQARAVIGTYFNSYLFGNHPYGKAGGGDEKTLAAITRNDVVKFYQTYYSPSNAILAVVGDFSAAEMERTIADRFGAWSGQEPPAIPLPEPEPAKGRKLLLVDKPDSTQTFYLIGNVGITRTSPDRVFVEVVNTLFGGRFTSMLNSELRVKSGLTYGAGSSFARRKARGPFVISSFTRNDTTEKALDMTLDILKRLHEKGITEEELKSAKSYLKGQFPPEIETSNQLADLITELDFYGLDAREVEDYFARIDSMTLADARRVIKEHFPLDNLVFVLIGKADELRGVVGKYASKVDTKAITDHGF